MDARATSVKTAQTDISKGINQLPKESFPRPSIKKKPLVSKPNANNKPITGNLIFVNLARPFLKLTLCVLNYSRTRFKK